MTRRGQLSHHVKGEVSWVRGLRRLEGPEGESDPTQDNLSTEPPILLCEDGSMGKPVLPANCLLHEAWWELQGRSWLLLQKEGACPLLGSLACPALELAFWPCSRTHGQAGRGRSSPTTRHHVEEREG